MSEEEKAIVNLIKSDPYISAKKISELLNKSSRSIQRTLASLKDKKYLERIGGAKGYWKLIQ